MLFLVTWTNHGATGVKLVFDQYKAFLELKDAISYSRDLALDTFDIGGFVDPRTKLVRTYFIKEIPMYSGKLSGGTTSSNVYYDVQIRLTQNPTFIVQRILIRGILVSNRHSSTL